MASIPLAQSAAPGSGKLLTAEEFFRRGDPNRRSELVRGREIDLNQPGYRHGKICSRIGRVLGNFVEEHLLGDVVGNDSGIVTQRNPDTVRGADVAFFSLARKPQGEPPDGYHHQPPDLVFEVVSPSDRMSDVLQKVAEYLAAGVTAVCLVEPDEKSITVYRDQSPSAKLAKSDVLTLDDILPGFQLSLEDLFA